MAILGNPLPKFGGGGGAGDVVSADLEKVENKLATLTLRLAIENGWTYFNLIDGIADEFEDETGVNGTPTTADYVAASDKYGKAAGGGYSILVQSETTNGSTTFTDSSSNAHSITVGGDAQHSTAQAKFGSSSMLFDGTGDYLRVSDDSSFELGTSNFTMSAFIYPNALSGDSTVMSKLTTTGNQRSYWLVISSAGALQLWGSFDGNPASIILQTATSTITTGSWQHVEVTRDGNDFKMFVDGTQEASQTNTINFFDGTASFMIGGWNETTGDFDGYIEEARLILGSAENTSNFTPPTAPYSPIADNFILQSISFPSEAVATQGRVVFLFENVNTLTINTDVKASISRDGGTTFTELTIEDDGPYDGTLDIIVSSAVDISAQPSGQNMVFKIETFNNKAAYVHGVWFQWD